MTSSRLFDAVDAVVATLRAANLVVWDGPIATADGSEGVFVGHDGAPTTDWLLATLDQTWAGLGAKARDEKIDIMCAAVAVQLDDAWSVGRARARAVLETAGAALRADPSLGQPPPFTAGLKPVEAFQELLPNLGCQVRLTFLVSIDTRV